MHACMQLENRDVQIMLKKKLPVRTRAAARANAEKRLQGRILTTKHGIEANYQFVQFSELSALSSFPEDEKRRRQGEVQYASFAEYFQGKYGIQLVYLDAPLIEV
jgi:hypothetical protein